MQWETLLPVHWPFHLAIFIGTLLIVTEWAKYGFSLLGTRPLARLGVFINVVACLVAGARRSFPLDNSLTLGILGLCIAVFLTIRAAKSPDLMFKRTLLEMRQWTRYNYAHGKILPEKGIRNDDPYAKRTVEALKVSIATLASQDTQEKQRDLVIAHLELGLLYRMMNLWPEAQTEMEVSLQMALGWDACPPQEDLVFCVEMKWPKAVASKKPGGCCSVDFLEKAKVALEKWSGKRPDLALDTTLRLQAESSHRKRLAETMGTVLFRRAELHQVTGNLPKARELYRWSLVIHERLGDRLVSDTIRKLINAIRDTPTTPV